jgi:hypothetical protein
VYRQDNPETGSARAMVEAFEIALKPEPGQQYKRIKLIDLPAETFGNAAELEYTNRERLNLRAPYGHSLERTVIGRFGSAYTLTFTVSADSAAAAEADWAKIAPDVATILSTFKVTN